MWDIELAREILGQILWSTQTILKRFAPIVSPNDFLSSDDGLEKLDSICMQLIAIGESVKNLEKVTEHRLLAGYPGIPWQDVMGMRDVLSRHYFDLNAEVVYGVCQHDIAELQHEIERMLVDLQDYAI